MSGFIEILKEKELIKVEGNLSILLNENKIWAVVSGEIDLFLVNIASNEPQGIRKRMFTAKSGDLLFGSDFKYQQGILATGLYGTRLIEISNDDFKKISKQYKAEVSRALEDWFEKLWDSSEQEYIPDHAKDLATNEMFDISEDTIIKPKETFLWFSATNCKITLEGAGGTNIDAICDNLPVGRHCWVKVSGNGKLKSSSTVDLIDDEGFLSNIFTTNNLLMVLTKLTRIVFEARDIERINRKKVSDVAAFDTTLKSLRLVLSKKIKSSPSISLTKPIYDTIAMVCNSLNIKISKIPQNFDSLSNTDLMDEVIRLSRIRTRKVALREDWWAGDNGPLLAFLKDNNKPVALLPISHNKYELRNPETGEQFEINREVASLLEPFAYTFYRPFPAKKLTIKEVISFGFKNTWKKDLVVVLLAGLVGGIIALILPEANSMIFDKVIPSGRKNDIWPIGSLLLGVALSGAMFQIVRSFASLRLKDNINSSVQGAVWDRLLSLPVPFFKNFTAGELANRAMGINNISEMISDTLLSSVITGVFSLLYVFQMFHYSSELSKKAIIPIVVAILFTFLIGYLQINKQKELMKVQTKLSGFVFQILKGIAKIKNAGAEVRAFSKWASRFKEQRELSYKTQNISNVLVVFNDIFTIAASMLIYWTVIKGGQDGVALEIKPGSFIAFSSAFGAFTGVMLQLTNSLIMMIAVKPAMDMIKPILSSIPEFDDAKQQVGRLTGRIEVSNVSFRYDENGPLVLNDINITINMGEYVAIVGPSGSGKSTLFRMLLGFEEPEIGTVYYDGNDIKNVDIRSIRKQIGVVMQNGKLMAGDIFSNIIGANTHLTIDDAWEAARLAGVAEDIQRMPMGMHTMISEGSGTISGGQKQRIMIARAIVNKPRIVFFDEATSALDNRTQAIVSESLERLNATRIVIAHRLSTIVNCDRIIILQKGQLVESGSYNDLIALKGVFAELASRQIA